jgi:hypothetical protein
MKKIIIIFVLQCMCIICLAQNRQDTVAYEIKTQDTIGTYLQIFFTDGKGEFYNNEPMVRIDYANTKKVCLTFLRETDKKGNPKIQRIDTGLYHVVILGNQDLVLKNIDIQKNTITKLYFIVSDGTLIFTYQNNRSRPVNHTVEAKKWSVNEKIEEIIIFSATEQKKFRPGQYIVALDILPKYNVYTEISFGATTEVQIPQEGELHINTITDLDSTALYYESGYEYECFMNLSFSPNYKMYPIQLRPGMYKAISFKKSDIDRSNPITVTFIIRPNKVTIFEKIDYNGKLLEPDIYGKPVYTNEILK